MITYKVEIDELGDVRWYNEDGLRHRIDGPAYEGSDGLKMWYVNGKIHRLDGPAIECANGYKAWWVNGELHRLDGPALEWPDGYKEWWIEDKNYTEEQFHAKIAEMS
jgi:hypothetical protein